MIGLGPEISEQNTYYLIRPLVVLVYITALFIYFLFHRIKWRKRKREISVLNVDCNILSYFVAPVQNIISSLLRA